jgi:hypothetical protein
MSSKEDLIEGVIELGSKTGQFSASKGKDTDLIIEREIVNADCGQLVRTTTPRTPITTNDGLEPPNSEV